MRVGIPESQASSPEVVERRHHHIHLHAALILHAQKVIIACTEGCRTHTLLDACGCSGPMADAPRDKDQVSPLVRTYLSCRSPMRFVDTVNITRVASCDATNYAAIAAHDADVQTHTRIHTRARIHTRTHANIHTYNCT